jgi:ABC-type Zn2+ transport system substrate-binding protein/surface adhesin
MTIPSHDNPVAAKPRPTKKPNPRAKPAKPERLESEKKKEREHQNRRQRQGKTKKQKKDTQNLSNEEHGKQNDDHDRAWLATDIQKMIEAACAKTVNGALAARAHSAASPQVVTAQRALKSSQRQAFLCNTNRMMDVCSIFVFR